MRAISNTDNQTFEKMDVSSFLSHLRKAAFLGCLNDDGNELQKAINRYVSRVLEGGRATKLWDCEYAENKIEKCLFFYMDTPFRKTPLMFVGKNGTIGNGDKIFTSPLYAEFLLYDLGFFTAVEKPKEKFHVVWTDPQSILSGIDPGGVTRRWFSERANNRIEHSVTGCATEFHTVLAERLRSKLASINEVRILHFEDIENVYQKVFNGECNNVEYVNVLGDKPSCDKSFCRVDKAINKCNRKGFLENPVIFIVDILWNCQEKHGVDLIRHIRRRTQNWPFPPPIIVYTGYSYPQLVSQCFRLGVDFVVFKQSSTSEHTNRISSSANQDISEKQGINTLLWLILWYVETIKLLKAHVGEMKKVEKDKKVEKSKKMETVSEIQNCIPRWLGVTGNIWQSENCSDLAPNSRELDKLPFSLRAYFPHLFRFFHATRRRLEFPEASERSDEDYQKLKDKAYGMPRS